MEVSRIVLHKTKLYCIRSIMGDCDNDSFSAYNNDARPLIVPKLVSSGRRFWAGSGDHPRRRPPETKRIFSMPDRKAKPRSYHPRRFKKGDGCDAVASLILDENNAGYEFYHSGSSQDVSVINSRPAGKYPRLGIPRRSSGSGSTKN